VAAKGILAALGVVFLALAMLRILRDRGQITPASRTWLIVGIIFTGVSAYLWMSG
jgi:hypothetical protein